MSKIKVAFDIGSSKILILLGELTDSGKNIRIIKNQTIPSRGIKRGIIENSEKLTEAIKKAIAEISDETKINIDNITMSYSSKYIKSITISAELEKEEDFVFSSEQLDELIKTAKSKHIPEDEVILRAEVYNIRVDESGILKSIDNFKGKKLTAAVHLITEKKELINSYVEVLNRCGISVEEIIFSGEAAAISTLSEIDKKKGTAIVDIGNSTTDIAIYKNRKLIYGVTLPLGEMHYVGDICYLLEIDELSSRKILEDYTKTNLNEISYFDLVENSSKIVEREYLKKIIDSRTEDFATLIEKRLRESGYKDYLKNGIVLTGGALWIPSLQKRIGQRSNHLTRIGNVMEIDGLTKTKTSMAVGVGILLKALENEYKLILENEEDLEQVVINSSKEEEVKENNLKEKEEITKNTEESSTIKKELPEIKENNEGIFCNIKKWLSNFI